MIRYYIERDCVDSQEHLVHSEGCSVLPSEVALDYVGRFNSTREAMVAARDHYEELTACPACSPELKFLESKLAIALAEMSVAARYSKVS